MADNAQLDALWRSMGNTGDRPIGWFGPGGSPENPNYSSTPVLDYNQLFQQQLQMQKEANAPVIQSLQASIPEMGQKFATAKSQLEAEKTPLEERYANLLAQITGNQAKEEQRTGLGVAQELGRRGISSQSGLFTSETNKALSPISQFYTGQTKEVGLARESDLRELSNQVANLTNQEVEATRAVQNAIAQLQAGGSKDAAQNALALLTAQNAQQNAAANLQIAQKELEIAQSQANTTTSGIKYASGAGGYLYDSAGNIITTLPKLAGYTGGGTSDDDIISTFEEWKKSMGLYS